MSVLYNNKKIGKGICFSEVYDNKFKTNLVTVRFITKLNEELSPKISLLFDVLGTSNKNIKSRSKLNEKLINLYDSTLKTFTYSYSDYLVAGMSVNFISDKYTIDDEKISTEVVKILLDCIFDPDVENELFNDKYFNQSKNDLIETIKSQINDRHGYANIRANSFIFKDEPTAIYENGTVEIVEKINNKDLYPVYKDLLKNSFIDISVVGQEENHNVNQLVLNEFENLNRNNNISIDFLSPSTIKKQPLEVSEKFDVNQCKMIMAFKTDSEDLYAQKVMSAIFGGTPFSKLFTNVREKLSLCYYCHSTLGTFLDCKATMLVDSGIDKSNIEKAKAEIVKQLMSIIDGDFSDEIFENSKKSLCNNIRSSKDNVAMLNSFYFTQRVNGTNYSIDEVNKNIENVSRDRVIQAAKSFKLDTVYILEPEV